MVDDRVAVKTYVPRYQKEEWNDHANELNMSLSEFVRTMVQAGRSDLEVPSLHDGEPTQADEVDDNRFEERILAALEQNDVLDWDELTDRLINDVENDLDDALERLQDENLVMYSGRNGGYVLNGHE